MSEPAATPRPRPTDSPWFWALCFSFMALVGGLAIAPKFDRRQGRLEARYAGRHEAAVERARRTAGLPPVDLADEAREPDVEPRRLVPLWPLAVAAGLAAAGSAVMLWRERAAVVLVACTGLFVGEAGTSLAAAPDLAFADETLDQWHGFRRHRFTFQGRSAWVVEPAAPVPGNPWSWCMIFPDAFTQRCAAPQLLARGFHHAFLDVGNTFGSPAAIAELAAFHDELVRRGLAARATLIGISRGGLYAHRFATEHPRRVAAIYGDGAVCDFKSWPGGKGLGKGSPGDWRKCIAAYGFADEAAAIAYAGNPIDTLPVLAAAKIPVVHVVGDADDVVPPEENALVVERRYRELGGEVLVIRKPGGGHHPHGLDDPAPVVEFLVRHAPAAP